jgi:uncharacterized protein YndB with AHSA1/START domain
MNDRPGQSDDAVRKATGRGWEEWETLLDALGAARLSHSEIVSLLHEKALVRSGWWRQSVTVGYEKLKGRRKTGETKDTGVQVGVQRTLPVIAETAWELLTSAEGRRVWLGSGADFRFAAGEIFRLKDGAEGEVRVVRQGRQGWHARLTYQPGEWPRPSVIQVRVEPRGDRAVIGFHEEHLPSLEERERRKAHFAAAADALREMAGR